MIVSDLIKILEKHKDKKLYFLNVSATNEVTEIKKQIVDDNLFLKFTQKTDNKFIADFVSLKDGFSVRTRNEEEPT